MWCVWSYCECCILFSPLPRVLCHSIVGLVPCLCDSVVSLWNSGDGLCWVEGRVVSTVYCQLFMCCVVEWRWGGGVCGLVAYLPLLFVFFFFFFFVVGVRGSARAARRARTLSPNTIVFFVCFVFSSSLHLSPFFMHRLSCYCGMAVGYHVLVCCVGMTATGSLSRSSSFF